MGACCLGRPSLDEPEQFIQDIINSMKIRDFSFSQFQKTITANSETKRIQGKEVQKFKYQNYEKVIDEQFTNPNDPFYKFQRSLIIDYEQYSFDYSIYVWAFSFLKRDKHIYLEDILKKQMKDAKELKELTFENFKEFLLYYLQINLVEITNRIKNQLDKATEDNIKNYALDETFKSKMDDLVDNYYSLDKFYLYRYNIVQQIEKIPRKDNNKVDQVFFRTLNQQMGFLFDVNQLRTHYLNEVTHKDYTMHASILPDDSKAAY